MSPGGPDGMDTGAGMAGKAPTLFIGGLFIGPGLSHVFCRLAGFPAEEEIPHLKMAALKGPCTRNLFMLSLTLVKRDLD